MNRLLYILILCSLGGAALSQTTTNNQAWYYFSKKLEGDSLYARSAFYAPVRDTSWTPTQIGAMVYKSTDQTLYVCVSLTGQKWQALGASGATWGTITGTLSSQTDLQDALDAKQDAITLGTTAHYLKGNLTLGTFSTDVRTVGDAYYSLQDHTHDYNDITDFTTGVRNSVSAGTGLTYNPVTGILSLNDSALNEAVGVTTALAPLYINSGVIGIDTTTALIGTVTKGRLYKALDSIKVTMDLQAVTDAGYITTNPISAGGFYTPTLRVAILEEDGAGAAVYRNAAGDNTVGIHGGEDAIELRTLALKDGTDIPADIGGDQGKLYMRSDSLRFHDGITEHNLLGGTGGTSTDTTHLSNRIDEVQAQVDGLTLDGLTDVAISGSVSNGNVLKYNGTQWVDAANTLPTVTQSTLTDGATITWDYLTQGSEATVTLAGNRALSITNLPAGEVVYLTLTVKQDATGSRTLTLPASTKVINGGAGAVTLTTTGNATDILTFRWSGTTLYCNYGKNYN